MFGLIDCNNFFVSCERVFNPRLAGKPVAVLSNNDGCVVSRSAELKALGVPMCTPYFKIKPLEKTHGVVFLSSNYELYADMSRRVMNVIRESAPKLEQYSIDEAFVEITLPNFDLYLDFGLQLRKRILKWTGIPTGIGFAPSRTLAKLASHKAKTTPDGDGVFVMPQNCDHILAETPLDDIWGIGRRLHKRLFDIGIRTAKQLADTDITWLTKHFNVCLARTALELNGKSTGNLIEEEQPLKSITCSKSFGTPITELHELKQAFFSYASEAARRLRENQREAAGACIFVQYADDTLPFDHPRQYASMNLVFPDTTANTSAIQHAIEPHIHALFRKNIKHKKCGIVCFGLENPLAQQPELFNQNTPPPIPDTLYKALDAINRQFGKNTVFSAAEGIHKNWDMKRQRLTRHYTTDWDDIPNAF